MMPMKCMPMTSMTSISVNSTLNSIMHCTLQVAVAVALLAVAAPAGFAQDRARAERAEMTTNQISDRVDARIALLKADLRLTPDQDNNWANLAAVLHDIGMKSAERRMSLRDEPGKGERSPDLADDMRRMADFHSERADELRKLADATQPFFSLLDDPQKRRFVSFLRQNDRDR
jgi:zinc resistance-associated protein